MGLRHPGHRGAGLRAFHQYLLPQRGRMLPHLLACRVFHRVHDRVVMDTRLAQLLAQFKMGCPDAHTMALIRVILDEARLTRHLFTANAATALALRNTQA